jgi:hypothetical protein
VQAVFASGGTEGHSDNELSVGSLLPGPIAGTEAKGSLGTEMVPLAAELAPCMLLVVLQATTNAQTHPALD